MLTLLFGVITSQAGVTDLPKITTDEGNPVWYTISNTRSTSGQYLYYAGDAVGLADANTITANSFFYFTGSYDALYIHNFGTTNKLASVSSWTADGIAWQIAVTPYDDGSAGLAIGPADADISSSGNFINERNYDNLYTTWSANDAGSIFYVELVTDFTSVIDVDAYKTQAVATLNSMKTLNVLFESSAIDTAITQVQNVTPAGTSLSELDAACKQIDNIVNGLFAALDGKNVRFTSYGRNATDGQDLAYSGQSYPQGVSNSGDAGIWTLSDNGDGTFKLYNFIGDVYIGVPGNSSATVPFVSTASNGGSYTPYIVAENTIALQENGKTLHVEGWYGNIVRWDDTSAGASQFVVSAEAPIAIERASYIAAATVQAELPYELQQAYGLVQDGSKYSSNAPETVAAEGSSYVNLLDNNTGSYFHTAWSYGAGENTPHYLQAELSESIDKISFYYYRRTSNNNNRPTTIVISASNDGSDFAQITTISEGLPTAATDNSYMSDVIDLGAKYKHIRFTVTNTSNTGTDKSGNQFFTFSEFYIFPGDGDAKTIVESYKNFASLSIQDAGIVAAANTLNNAGTTLALSNIKKQIKAVLDANENNHATTPALGQYSTETYTALSNEYNNVNATQETLEAALAAFDASKNKPVFTIDGVISYAAGKSIYDNNSGTLYFKTTNKFDKSMLWAFDQSAQTVGVTESVVVKNIATDNLFWNAASLKIYETSDAVEGEDDGIFLFQTAGNTTPVHAQNSNQQVVRWNSTESTSGSAWKFTYVCSTYELSKLTDEHILALEELNAAYSANADLANANIGTNLGQYGGDLDALNSALAAAQAIAAKSVAEIAAMEVSDITAAKDAITAAANSISYNMPSSGSYYRFESVTVADAYMLSDVYSSNAQRLAMGEGTGAASIFYLTDNYSLLSYKEGLYLPAAVRNGDWTCLEVGSDIPTVHIGKGYTEGSYGFYIGEDASRAYYSARGTYVDAGGQIAANNGYDWYIEVVTSLPVTISSAGYSTFYTPVEVSIPEGLEAYTATEQKDNYIVLSPLNGVIPAGTAVVLKGEAGDYSLEISNTGAAAVEGNLLVGTVAKELVTKESTTSYYVLSVKDGAVGMYEPVNGDDTTTFLNAGHKAYLAIEGAAQSASLHFGFEGTTGIDAVASDEASEALIYDLTGRRVSDMSAPGVYIVNGRKVLVK